jgi:transcription termination factor Rho
MSIINKNKLEECKVKELRRLARFLKVKKYYKLNKKELIEEICWKIDPWKDLGMY